MFFLRGFSDSCHDYVKEKYRNVFFQKKNNAYVNVIIYVSVVNFSENQRDTILVSPDKGQRDGKINKP